VIKEMKKSIVMFGAAAIVLLMVSSATAVPQVQSEPVMKIINDMEQKKTMLEEKLASLTERLLGAPDDPQPTFIIRILLWLIKLIDAFFQTLIDIILTIGDFIAKVIKWLEDSLNQIYKIVMGLLGLKLLETIVGILRFILDLIKDIIDGNPKGIVTS